MRIAHVAAFGNPMPGSFIPNIFALAQAVQERGDDFTFIVMNVPGASWHDEMRRRGVRLVLTDGLRDAYEAVVTARPQIVHAHFLGLTLPATLAAWRTGARLFWHLHTGQSQQMTALRRVKGELRYRVLGRRAERFVTVSQSLADELRRWGVDGGKTVVVNNAVDVERFRPPTAEERAERRARLGLGAGERVLTFFGRDTYYKGTDLLLDALDEPLPLTVLAVGLPDETKLAMRRRTRTVALDRVSDARDLYWASDGIVMPSRFESAPYTLMEAISCGLPAVVSDIPPMRELAAGLPAVRFAPCEDAGALRRALEAELAAPTQSALDATTRERFSLERWARDVLALYN